MGGLYPTVRCERLRTKGRKILSARWMALGAAWPLTADDIRNLTGFYPNDCGIYQQAFVHKSAVRLTGIESNERLEFLGDAVLSLAVNDYLFHKHMDEREGFMTRLKTKLVSGTCLAGLAEKIGLSRHIAMNKKALNENWCCNKKMRENVLEALIAAIYKDKGFSHAKHFVIDLISRHIDHDSLALHTNAKDQLMFYTQQHKIDLPDYQEIPVPADTLVKFAIQTFVEGVSVGLGCGQTKREAEMVSARCALETLGVPTVQPREYVI